MRLSQTHNVPQSPKLRPPEMRMADGPVITLSRNQRLKLASGLRRIDVRYRDRMEARIPEPLPRLFGRRTDVGVIDVQRTVATLLQIALEHPLYVRKYPLRIESFHEASMSRPNRTRNEFH